MKKVMLISLSLLLASGCASTGQQNAQVDYKFPSIETSQTQAKAYVAELHLKKKRFIERQLLANATAYADPQQLAADAEQGNDTASVCQGLANSEWASSVQYGQNFLSYDNHIETLKRCFEEEKRASLTDITTAMN